MPPEFTIVKVALPPEEIYILPREFTVVEVAVCPAYR